MWTTAVQAEPLPCLDSSQACVEKLSTAAITQSSELKTLEERTALIDKRVELSEERIQYSERRSWTNYITTDPVKLIQNLFGGGDVQRDRLAIADLEIKAADLEAARAELERQREAKKSQLSEQILTLVLSYEAAARQEKLIHSQLENHSIMTRVIEIDYKFGGSSTSAYLAAIEKREQLGNQLIIAQTTQAESVRKLLSLTGFSGNEDEQ